MNKNMLLGLASLTSAAFGVVVGALLRQPEINKLKKQVKTLQSSMDELENVIERQHAEISRLYTSYKATGAFSFLKKREAKASLEEALILQYATVEYLEMIVACARGDIKLNDADVQFYKAYGNLTTTENIADKDKDAVERYVMSKHSASIRALCQADTDKVLTEIRDFDKPEGRGGIRLPFGSRKARPDSNE